MIGNGAFGFVFLPTFNRGDVVEIAIDGAVVLGLLVVYSCVALLLLAPVTVLSGELHEAGQNTATGQTALAREVDRLDLLAFARSLRTHAWSAAETTLVIVFLTSTTAGLLGLLVSANPLGLPRPEIAGQLLPWVLGVAIIVSMAFAATRMSGADSKGDRLVPLAVMALAVCAITLVTIIKVEATNVPPADYVAHHPLKHALLGPAWLAIELTAAGGAGLAHEGLHGSVRGTGWLLGLLLEAAVYESLGALNLVLWALQLLLWLARITLRVLFEPGALLYRVISKLAGSDLDGNNRFPPLSGGGLAW